MEEQKWQSLYLPLQLASQQSAEVFRQRFSRPSPAKTVECICAYIGFSPKCLTGRPSLCTVDWFAKTDICVLGNQPFTHTPPTTTKLQSSDHGHFSPHLLSFPLLPNVVLVFCSHYNDFCFTAVSFTVLHCTTPNSTLLICTILPALHRSEGKTGPQ